MYEMLLTNFKSSRHWLTIIFFSTMFLQRCFLLISRAANEKLLTNFKVHKRVAFLKCTLLQSSAMANTVTVTILSSTLVAPKLSSNSQAFHLTVFDRGMFRVPFQKRVIFFPSPQPSHLPSLLQQSLSEVLVYFFPLAGRLQPLEGTQTDLICNDEGVFFSEAVTDASIDDLGQFNPSPFTDSLIQTGNFRATIPWTADSPLLFIQITRFACGGISLGFAYAHQMVDGPSIWHFLKSWSEAAMGKPLSIYPLVSYAYSRAESSFKSLEDLGVKFAEEPTSAEMPSQDDKSSISIRCFNFDRAKIDSLKSSVPKSFTSFEIVCSHIWYKISKARSLASTQLTTMTMLLNSRNRLPSLPSNYFGNGAMAALAQDTTGELSSGGLACAAEKVHKAIKDSTSDRLQGIANWLEDMLDGKVPRSSFRRGIAGIMIAGSHRHPLYEVDFGFGKPVGATYGMDDWNDGKVYLLPGIGGQGIHATIALSFETMERLKQDPDFC